MTVTSAAPPADPHRTDEPTTVVDGAAVPSAPASTFAVSVAVAAEVADDLAGRTVMDPDAGVGGIDGLLRAVDRLIAVVVTVLVGVDRQGVVAAEGQTVASWLRSVGRCTGADAGMLLAAADRLGAMPATLAAFQTGVLSWGTVRGIVTATRSLTAAQRGWVDATLAADPDRLARVDGDTVVADVDRLADTARADLTRDRADRAAAAQQVLLQPALDGGGTLIATLDTETYTAVAAAITAVTHDPAGRRVASNVDALHALARTRTAAAPTDTNSDAAGDGAGDAAAGGHGTDDAPDAAMGVPVPAPSPARPEMIVVTDLATLADAHRGLDHRGTDRLVTAARVLWPHDRTPPRLTPDAARRLACDATLRPVLIEDGRILGVADAHARISTAMRTALAARDGGCRFPGCHRPVSVCEAHHLIHRLDGGPTRLHNHATLCRAHHRAVHEGGWEPTLHPEATMTFTRHGVTLHSHPRLPHTGPQPSRPPPPGRPHRRQPHPTRPPAPPQPVTEPPTADGADPLPF